MSEEDQPHPIKTKISFQQGTDYIQFHYKFKSWRNHVTASLWRSAKLREKDYTVHWVEDIEGTW